MSISVTNTDAGLSGDTLLTAEDAQTISGLKTFSRSTNPPFAVNAGAAAVTNLDADKLDGLEASALARAGGTLNTTQILAAAGTVGAPGLAVGEADCGLYNSGTNALDIATNGTKALGIDSTQFIDSPTQPRCSLYNTAAQSVNTATPTALTFDTEEHDTGAMHAGGSPSRITVPAGGDGVYLIGAASDIAQIGANFDATIYIRKNGTTAVSTKAGGGPTGASLRQTVHCQCLLSLVAGDYVEVIATQNTAGALNFGGASRETANQFWAVKLW